MSTLITNITDTLVNFTAKIEQRKNYLFECITANGINHKASERALVLLREAEFALELFPISKMCDLSSFKEDALLKHLIKHEELIFKEINNDWSAMDRARNTVRNELDYIINR